MVFTSLGLNVHVGRDFDHLVLKIGNKNFLCFLEPLCFISLLLRTADQI